MRSSFPVTRYSPSVATSPTSEIIDSFDLSVVPPGLVGFKTGAGRRIAPPSSAALAKVRKIFDETESQGEIVQQSLPHGTLGGPGPSTVANKRRRTHDEHNAGLAFTKASRVPVSPPSPESEKHVEDLFSEDQNASPPAFCAPTSPPKSLFAMAAGSAAPPVNSQSAAAVSRLFDDTRGGERAPPEPTRQIGFTTASGRKTASPSKAAMARAMAIFGEVDEHDDLVKPPSSSIFASRNILPDESPVSAAPRHFPALRSQSPAPFVPPHTARMNDLTTPSRAPLRTTTNLVPLPGSIFVTPQSKELKGMAIPYPSSGRRLGLGGTPASRGKPKPSFITPFKRPGALAHSQGPTIPLPRGMSAKHNNVIPTPTTVGKVFHDVFDMTCETISASTISSLPSG